MTNPIEETLRRAFLDQLDSLIKNFVRKLEGQTKHTLQSVYKKLSEQAIKNACISPHEYETLNPYWKSEYNPKDPNFQLIYHAVSNKLSGEIKKLENNEENIQDIFSQAYKEEYIKAIITAAKHKARKDAFRKAMNNDK